MKKIIFFLFAFSAFVIRAQNVGINSSGAQPDPSAMLDVVASDKGMLVPRVALTSATVASPVISPMTSLLVYNTATAGVSPNNVTPGYYFWDGVRWERLYSGTWLNGGATSAIGKFFVNGITLTANTITTFTITDANCTTSSAILSVSWGGLLPGTAAQNSNIRIYNVQAGTGQWVIQIANSNAATYTGLSLSYVAFY